MIEKYYQDVDVYKYSDGDFSIMAGYQYDRTIKGLVQTPNNSKTYNNGKDTSSVTGTLYCSINEEFEEKDIIDFKGIRYKIAGATTQPLGVCGITPQRGQHAQYSLIYVQEGI